MDDVATVDAPSSTPSAAPSAPSSSTAASSEPTVTTDRPSFKDALSVFNEAAKQQGRKPRGVAATPAPTTGPAAETVTQPGETPAAQPTTPKGPIPFEVHDTAIKNARVKGAQEADQRFQSQYGEIIQWANRAATDRVGFLRDVINEALQDPQLSQQIMSLAGSTLRGTRSAEPQYAEEPGPDIEGVDHNGRKVFTYSPEQLRARDQWFRDSILGEIRPDLDQLRSAEQQREERAQFDAAVQRNGQQITQARDQALNTWPHAKTFQKEIAAEIANMPLTDGHPASEMAVLNAAYWKVVGPQLSKLEAEKVYADLKKNAHASTLNPASTGAPTGIPKNVRAKDGGTMKDALAWAATQTGGR